MTTWFVSRHAGARQWALSEGLYFDRWVDHLWLEELRSGDVVAGCLPASTAAKLCELGASYLHLDMLDPHIVRRVRDGGELSAQDMRTLGARLCEVYVAQVHGSPALQRLLCQRVAVQEVAA